MPTKLPEPTWDADSNDWVLTYAPSLRFPIPWIARAMAISYGYPPEVFGKQGTRVGRGHIRPAVLHLTEIRVHGLTEPAPAEDAVTAWETTLRQEWTSQS